MVSRTGCTLRATVERVALIGIGLGCPQDDRISACPRFLPTRRFVTSQGPAEVLPRTPLGYEADTLQAQLSTSQPPAPGT